MKLLPPLALLATLFIAGCGDNSAEVSTTPLPKSVVEEQQSHSGKPAKKQDLAQLEKNSKEAREALAKNPKDVGLVQMASATIYEEAEAAMYDEGLLPREKYPRALKLYNEVVKIVEGSGSTDEKSLGVAKMARDSAKTIEDIYKQMNKPVPGT